MDMNYRIAIPSYKRPLTLQKKTLAYLQRCGVDTTKVDIFVADKQEYEEYALLYDLGYNVIIGAHTLQAQRQAIQMWYRPGTKVLCMDDDITGIYTKLNDKKFVEELDLNMICAQGFEACEAARTKLWGIYPVLNPMFMKFSTTFDLRYIVGCFWGVIIDHDDKLTVELEDKEDFERSILYYKKFGSVVRLNNYAPKTNYYGEPGGMQETRTEQRVTDSAVFLLQKYPNFCTLNTGKKSSHTEVRLKHKIKK